MSSERTTPRIEVNESTVRSKRSSAQRSIDRDLKKGQKLFVDKSKLSYKKARKAGMNIREPVEASKRSRCSHQKGKKASS